MAEAFKVRGAWSAARVERHLAASVTPLRLAIPGPSGFPLLVSLWFLYDEGSFWCAVQQASKVGTLLAKEGRCSFEVATNEPPYCGVRGRGRAELMPQRGREILGRLMDRYLGHGYAPLRAWLEARAETETALRIVPLQITSWDFSKRMKG